MPESKTESQPAIPKTTAADWTATAEDDEYNFYGEKRQRGGRKKRKKNKEAVEAAQNWDDIYDPSRPNSYEEYKHSEEKIREVREWKDLLYRHRTTRRGSSEDNSDRSERPVNSEIILRVERVVLSDPGQFAPPPSFAPPSNLNEEPPPVPLESPDDTTSDDAYARRMAMSSIPPPPADIPDDATGEDAYSRRMRLSQPQPPALPVPAEPPPPPAGQIARAPVRYSLPLPPDDIPASEAELEEKLEEQPRSTRPGQAGFAERLMSKYGWSKGQGLGASGQGIINPLYAKADKRKKKSDAEGGGYVTPASTGKILGGRKADSAQEQEGKFGAMSEVVKLEHMLDGMDLDEEMSRGEGGIMQEIGEECGEKYGSVKRVYIHREGSPLVFIHFVSQLSALRAVNALQGRVFAGNAISAQFWPVEKFQKGEYT